MENQFIVTFEIDPNPDQHFFETIPQQREHINRMMSRGKIISYSLSQDRCKLWCIIHAENEMEVMEIVGNFPLIGYMEYQIVPLMFHNSVFSNMPAFSMN